MNPHFTALEAAYQLHYYLWLKTHRLRPVLTPQIQLFAKSILDDVSVRHGYHLLELDMNSKHLRLLISLKPDHSISETIKKIKGNLQYEYRKAFAQDKLLAKGYFARTSGQIDLLRARAYVDNQIPHHGYKGDWTRSLKFKNEQFKSPAFHFDHCVSLLNYHLVFATQNRIPLFDEAIAPEFFEYLMAMSKEYSFAIDRIGLLPDHMHMIIEGIPSISVDQYSLSILNNTRDWLTQRYSGVLKETKAWDVWCPSYYAGTVGEYTNTQINSFLSRAFK